MTRVMEGPARYPRMPCQLSGRAMCQAVCHLLPFHKNSGNSNNRSPHLLRHSEESGSQEGARIQTSRKVGIVEGGWQCSQGPPLPW